MSNKLFVGNLPSGCTVETLQSFMSKFGTVTRVTLMPRPSPHGHICAFVWFADARDATNAIARANNKLIYAGSDRALRVCYSNDQAAITAATGQPLPIAMGPPTETPSLADISRLRCSRMLLQKWCRESGFEELIKGCFVRVLTGENSANKQVYRLCVVKGVEKCDAKRGYEFGGSLLKKHLLIEFGFVQKSIKMDYVSNNDVTPEEYQEWIVQLQSCNIRPPPVHAIMAKYKKIKAVVKKLAKMESKKRKQQQKSSASGSGSSSPSEKGKGSDGEEKKDKSKKKKKQQQRSKNAAAPQPTPVEEVAVEAAAPPPEEQPVSPAEVIATPQAPTEVTDNENAEEPVDHQGQGAEEPVDANVAEPAEVGDAPPAGNEMAE